MARIMSLNYSRQGKHRRLWRLAVATQPTIAGHQSAPCPEGTRIYQKPTASSEGAQLWDRHPLTLSWFRKAGQNIILNIIGDASVPLRGTHWGVSFLPTAALLRSLQWVSLYRSRSAEYAAHTQSVCIRGCVATAGRHSLLCLLRQLVALIQQVAIRFRCSFSATL